MLDVPPVDTPRRTTVMRRTQDGMPVKSIVVPEVEATDVPRITDEPQDDTLPLLISALPASAVTIAGTLRGDDVQFVPSDSSTAPANWPPTWPALTAASTCSGVRQNRGLAAPILRVSTGG